MCINTCRAKTEVQNPKSVGRDLSEVYPKSKVLSLKSELCQKDCSVSGLFTKVNVHCTGSYFGRQLLYSLILCEYMLPECVISPLKKRPIRLQCSSPINMLGTDQCTHVKQCTVSYVSPFHTATECNSK